MIAVIDGRNFLFITGFGTDPNLKSGENEEWFLAKMKENIKNRIDWLMIDWNITDFYLVFDGPDCFRKNIYPEYKNSRIEKPILIEKSEEKFLNEWSSEFGWKIVKQTGMEGDDWMSLITADKTNDYLLVTGDEDMHQLTIYDNVYVLSLVKKIVYGKNEIQIPYRYTFSHCNGYKTMYEKIWLGCKSDDVPKLLPRGKSETYFYKNFHPDWLEKSYSALEQNEYYFCPYIDIPTDEVYRNFKLTCLLHEQHKNILKENNIEPNYYLNSLNTYNSIQNFGQLS